MAVVERIQAAFGGPQAPGVPLPHEIQKRLDRGRERKDKDTATRRECWEFFRNHTYCYVDNGILRFTPTVTSVGGAGKPPHKVRQVPNLIQPIVRHEVSAATQRVPGYDIAPTTTDPEDYSAASLAKRVAYFLHDHADIRRVTTDVVTYAIVADMGFAWPQWDPTKGAPIRGEDVSTGDVSIPTFGANEVYWEPGLRFHESPWHCIEQAMSVEDAEQIDGFLGGRLTPDAAPEQHSEKAIQAKHLVLVTHYLERPCAKYPEGRWLTAANGRLIAGHADIEGKSVTRPYPGGEEPCIIPLSWVQDPDSDRDLGLVRFLLDPQRSFQDAWSKALEYKNRGLNPQILAPYGSNITNLTDEPGIVKYYQPVSGLKPEWEKPPAIPRELFEIQDRAERIVARIAAQNDIPNQVEAGKAIQALIERDRNARQYFLANLATFHSRLMRRCLELYQRHASEPRLLNIRGRLGWEPIKDFQGAQLRNQVDVRVLPGSLEPVTREQIQSKIATISQLYPGYLPPERAIAAMENGTGEEIVQEYDQHVARASRIIQRIKDGTLMDMPSIPNPKGFQPQIDPMTGLPVEEEPFVPGWMPRPWDRVEIHKSVFEGWMVTEEFETLTPDMQHAALLYYDALLRIEAQRMAEQAAAQNAMAEQQGMGNAAKKPMPSLPDGQPQHGGSLPA